MTQYQKWVRNSNPNDGVSEITLEDGSTLRQGVPVKLSAEDRKKYEALGLVFEDSSAAESREVLREIADEQKVGRDVQGTGPVFSRSDETTSEK
jgi:hypothetical protein